MLDQQERMPMGFFSRIIEKLRHHSAPESTGGSSPQQQQNQSAPPQGQQTAGTPQLQNVDVNAVLSGLAAKKGQPSNWQTSIVDTLKLLDLDSSLDARKELADELNVHVGAHGSAEQNIALQKAVMRKLAENGGKVPESLRH
jgi:hypothetical protein